MRLASTAGTTNVEELASAFGVTASTIRRDLAHLTREGRLARTYGGAMPVLVHPETTLGQRSGEAFEAKRAIARWAAGQIRPGESILLDKLYVLAHAAKNDARPVHAWARLPPGWTLVTDDGADPAALQAFAEAGIGVVVVDRQGVATG